MPKDFGFVPDPDNPGWHLRSEEGTGRFLDVFGAMRILVEGPGKARLRVQPRPAHLNINDAVHGGFMLALIDQALFVCPAALGIPGTIGGVTVDLSTQFLAPAMPDKPLDAVVEILRETGRMVFMRGLVEQDGDAAASFAGVIRKVSA